MVHWKGSETCWWSGGEGVNYWVEASGSRTDVRNTKKKNIANFSRSLDSDGSTSACCVCPREKFEVSLFLLDEKSYVQLQSGILS